MQFPKDRDPHTITGPEWNAMTEAEKEEFGRRLNITQPHERLVSSSLEGSGPTVSRSSLGQYRTEHSELEGQQREADELRQLRTLAAQHGGLGFKRLGQAQRERLRTLELHYEGSTRVAPDLSRYLRHPVAS